MSSQEQSSRFRKPLNDRLAEKIPRDPKETRPEPIVKTQAQTRLDRSDELAVAAVGALVLRKLAEFGQTRLFPRAIESVFDKATSSLTAQEVMNLEIEAYEIVDWLVGGEPLDDDAVSNVASRRGDVIVYDPHAPVIDLIRRSIVEHFDLKIDYFSMRRGQMNTRRITPTTIEAETYVNAWCHARRNDRVFRINRITRCVPVNGRPERQIERTARDASADGGTAPTQIPLLADDD